jgi:hypothetical protein
VITDGLPQIGALIARWQEMMASAEGAAISA